MRQLCASQVAREEVTAKCSACRGEDDAEPEEPHQAQPVRGPQSGVFMSVWICAWVRATL